MKDVICTCGNHCPVEEAKGNVMVAWCEECGDYANTKRDLSAEYLERLMDQADMYRKGEL